MSRPARLLAAVVALSGALACTSSTPPKQGTTTMRVTPPNATVNAGSAMPVHFVAIVDGGTGTVTWSFSGPDAGVLQAATGNAVDYLPPASATQMTDVVITASLSGSSLHVSAPITVYPNAVAAQQGSLWVTGSDPTTMGAALFNFSAAQYGMGGTLTPAVEVQASHSTWLPQGVAVDKQGNLWVTDDLDSLVLEFAPGQLGDAGAQQPLLVIATNPDGGSLPVTDGGFAALASPEALAFDGQGNLWVANNFNSTVVKFSAAQLAGQTGLIAPTPALVLNGQLNRGNYFEHPFSLAFDAQGNLWIPSYEGQSVVEYQGLSQLSGFTVAVPSVVLTNNPVSTVNAFDLPFGLAFDPQGNLWITNFNGGSVTKLNASRLTATQQVVPDVAVVNPDTSVVLDKPTHLAFDGNGNLFVSSRSKGGSIVKLANVNGLQGLVQADAGSVISNVSMNYGGLAFYPPPTNLPLFHP